MAPVTTNRASETAAQVLRDCGIYTYPVDPALVARQNGVRVLVEELDDDVSGLLVKKGKKSVIAINKAHHSNRHRFTIAHELGHYFLHLSKDKPLFVDRLVYFRNKLSSAGENQDEIEANQFAAELLMPEHFLREALKTFPGELSDLDTFRLANSFCVSHQAMNYRLVNLRLIDATERLTATAR